MQNRLLSGRSKLVAVTLLSVVFFSSSSDFVRIEELFHKLFEKNKKIQSLELTIRMKERIEDDINQKKSKFKLVLNPRKIYLRQEYPKKGLEVLFVEGTNNNKAFVNTNTFPWRTLDLNPLGDFMREGNHHSIFKSGFGFILGVLEHLYTKYENNLSEKAIYNGRVRYDNRYCHKITMNNLDFQFVNYTIGCNENLEDLSYKFNVNDFMLYSVNENIKSFDNLKPGTQINIPKDYCNKIILYIDEELHLLAGIKIFDDKGLYEEYTYSNVKVNPKFTDSDFDIENPKYGF